MASTCWTSMARRAMRRRRRRRRSRRWTCWAWAEREKGRRRGAAHGQAAAWPPALGLLQGLGEKANVISFNASITACARGSRWPLSLVLLEVLEERGLRKGAATLGALVAACERGAHWPGALELLKEYGICVYSIDYDTELYRYTLYR